MAADKLPELRQAASEALAAVYHCLSQEALLSSILSAAPALQLTLRQALSGVLPSLDTELQQASMAYNSGFRLGSPARKSLPSPGPASRASQWSSQSSQPRFGKSVMLFGMGLDCWQPVLQHMMLAGSCCLYKLPVSLARHGMIQICMWSWAAGLADRVLE